MYLKTIEIQGFKSFANKIVFEFHNGITGIVGPNGSGKSNVADAVRWVLGEQRIKQLRGSNMQDVIFSGTELRKPQGFAYVAITLDNSDHQLAIAYDQVTVARRIYRSGESEYLINGSPCRLKDINELFYDTGIGKEGYSIIGQGQIDKILSGKPEDRRELFDEAAGIVKFKRRKAIAQKKLEDEKQNLVRVNDILGELEKQVGPLKRQSEAAREYLRLKEELKHCEVNLFLLEGESLKAQMAQVREKEDITGGDLEDTKAQADQIRVTYEELDEVIAGLNSRMEECRDQKNQSGILAGNLEGQINVLLEQINTEKMNAEHIASRIQTIESDRKEKEGKIREYETDHGQLKDRAEESLNRQEAAQEALRQADEEIMLLDQQIETAKSDIILALNEKASLTAKQERYDTMLEQVQVRQAEVSQRLLRIKSDESVQEEQKKAEQVRLSETEEQIRELTLGQGVCEEELGRLDQDIRRLNRNISEKQQEYRSLETRLESLRNLAERYEGYGGSIRRVMEARDRIRGIHGVVADIITTEKAYETAIETALGGSIQNVVTDSETTAKQLIEYLKKNKYGRATFLPLTSVSQKGGFSQEKALKEPGVLGLASELVKTDAQYMGVVRYLLGRVVVVDQIDHAIALAKRYQYSLRIVTLDGELLSAGGSMTGGAFKNSSNLLGRKREIEELEGQRDKTARQVVTLKQELELSEAQLSEKREEQERLRKELQEQYLKQNTIRMGLSRLEDKIQEISESSEDLVLESAQLREQLAQLTEGKRELREDVEGLESRKDETGQKIESLTRSLEDAKKRREILAADFSEAQLATAALKQKYDFALENVNRLKDEICHLAEEKERLLDGVGDTDQVIAGKNQEIEELRRRILHTRTQMEEAESRLQAYGSQKDERAGEQRRLFEKREELSERLGRLDKELFRLQSQREKLEENLERQIHYMWSEYELTYTTAEELRKEDAGTAAELKRQSESFKGLIKGLGNVNVNAIEDYKEVSERYEFMKTQHDDLIQAEATLLQIIEELDTGMRTQFEEKFKEIRREFDKVFKELFGGGHGQLELVEGEDILEAGIQIISQPPGKKLQNMMQLSGGEKALTAIALMFAIQNLKPSPFCLLDEIEAALDDSNVDRFAGYLHKLTKNTQFIVITHRRGTMVAADRLYGITMQEKGVSTLVSVNLIESDLDK